MEVVYEAHAAAQHGAGAEEVGDHLLAADAAIPVGGAEHLRWSPPQDHPPLGNPCHRTGPHQTPGFDPWCREEKGHRAGVRQLSRPLLTSCAASGKSLQGFLPRKRGLPSLPGPLHRAGVQTQRACFPRVISLCFPLGALTGTSSEPRGLKRSLRSSGARTPHHPAGKTPVASAPRPPGLPAESLPQRLGKE